MPPPKQEHLRPTSHGPSAKRDKAELTHQVEIIHLSDLRFGNWHRFNPKVGPDGKPLLGTSKISLLDKLTEDLNVRLAPGPRGEKAPPPSTPVVLCFTGDFAEGGAYEEFSQAQKFLQQVVERFPSVRSKRSV